MSTLYIDNIAPNLQSKISAPNLQLPSGSIIQVKTGTFTTSNGDTASSNSTSFVDSGLSVTFDNDLASGSKVYCMFNVTFGQTDATSAWANPTHMTIYEGGVNRGDSSTGLGSGNANAGGGGSAMQYELVRMSGSTLFTPSTTVTPTCSLYYRTQASQITSYINRAGNTSSTYNVSSTITLMEVAG